MGDKARVRKSGQELVFLFSKASLPIPGWPSHCPTRLPPLVVLLPQHGETAIMCQLLDKHMTYILPEVKHQSQHHDLLCQLWDMLSYNSHGALSAARLARSGSAPLEATRILCMDGIERIFEKTAICPTPKLRAAGFLIYIQTSLQWMQSFFSTAAGTETAKAFTS